jgi:selT/selW/selH-like putative selenoprotein
VEAVRKTHGAAVQTQTILGSGGIFDVAIDGELVFRKWDQYRFPTNQEILNEIAKRMAKT